MVHSPPTPCGSEPGMACQIGLRHSAFFMVQLSHLYVTTEKIVVLTLWTFVCKVISSLFNTLSRFVPPLVWTQCLPLYSGSGFRQPISQHFHSMVPKLAVRAKAQHGSRRQQFGEGLPEHRLEASWMNRGSSEKPLY